MTALLPIAAALLQLPATPPGFPVARLEITPAAAAVEGGQQLRLTARAFDAAGQPGPRAQIEWFAAGYESDVDSTGLVTGSYAGVAPRAAGGGLPGRAGQKIESAWAGVRPGPPAGSDTAPARPGLAAARRPRLIARPSAAPGARRGDLVHFPQRNPRGGRGPAAGGFTPWHRAGPR